MLCRDGEQSLHQQPLLGFVIAADNPDATMRWVDRDKIVACSDCSERDDETLKFVLLSPHDEAYRI